METVAVLKAMVTYFYTTKKLHEHWLWFWDVKKEEYAVHHIEPSTFWDGTPIFQGTSSATLMHLRFVNCPTLLQRPGFQFPLYALKDKENSGNSLRLLRWYSKKIKEIMDAGIKVSFSKFDDTYFVPKTEIPLNGDFLIRFGKNMFAADAKAQLFQGGCLSATQSFFPWWKLHTDMLCRPETVITEETFVTYADQVLLHSQPQNFRFVLL
jgi:hypothetical protein